MNDTNPLSWLPKPGEFKAIPGGIIWCDSWEVNQNSHSLSMEGEVHFQFRVSAEAYREATQGREIPEFDPAILNPGPYSGPKLIE